MKNTLPDENSDLLNPSHRAEHFIGTLLKYGVLVCGGFLASGMVIKTFSITSSKSASDFDLLTHGGTIDSFVPKTASELFQSSLMLSPEFFFATGTLLLIALPFTRVGLTFIIFFIKRDKFFSAVTFLVLCLLIVGLYIGAHF